MLGYVTSSLSFRQPGPPISLNINSQVEDSQIIDKAVDCNANEEINHKIIEIHIKQPALSCDQLQP